MLNTSKMETKYEYFIYIKFTIITTTNKKMCFPRCQKISFYDFDQPGLLSLIKTKAIQIYLLFEIKLT